MRELWHGCLFWVLVISTLPVSAKDVLSPDITRVRTAVFDIDYTVNEQALPLTSVELWYTYDEGRTWNNAGLDPDGQPPFRFTANVEGLFGFYLVAKNGAGVSGPTPTSQTVPQHQAFVDFTPPVVQIHPVRGEQNGSDRTLNLKWTALDAHLAHRPVELNYRALPDGRWFTIARALSNTGRYDWKVPASVKGQIMVRVTARDQAGNRVNAATGAIRLDALFLEQAPRKKDLNSPTVIQLTPEEKDRAQKLLEQGMDHLKKGEAELAVSRLRDALQADPSLASALVSLGDALYDAHSFEDSADAYSLAKARNVQSREVFEGLARSYVAMKDYNKAAEQLNLWLKDNQDDVEAWLNLGDVEMWRGDELRARLYYQRATSLDPDEKEIIRKARERLDNMNQYRKHVARLSQSDTTRR